MPSSHRRLVRIEEFSMRSMVSRKSGFYTDPRENFAIWFVAVRHVRLGSYSGISTLNWQRVVNQTPREHRNILFSPDIGSEHMFSWYIGAIVNRQYEAHSRPERRNDRHKRAIREGIQCCRGIPYHLESLSNYRFPYLTSLPHGIARTANTRDKSMKRCAAWEVFTKTNQD